MAEQLFEDIFSKKKGRKQKGHKELLDKLYTAPTKDKGDEVPHFQNTKENAIHQADIIMMPDDKGYKYILTVVDVSTRKADAEALKNKDTKTIVKAFEDIYKRKILNKPLSLEVDAGSEFKGDTAKWFSNHGVDVRTGQPGRHRQQGLVERKNQDIVKGLNKRMSAHELLTGQKSTAWKKDLPVLIKVINKYRPMITESIDNNYEGKRLLPLGTRVRVMLDKPVDPITGRPLHGKFRTQDLRWDPKIRVIRQILLKPGFPIMYLLDGKHGKFQTDKIARTYNQLQAVSKTEKYPNKDLINDVHNQKYFVVEEILGEERIKGRKYLKIKWAGFAEPTLEPYAHMKKENPEMVKEFEEEK